MLPSSSPQPSPLPPSSTSNPALKFLYVTLILLAVGAGLIGLYYVCGRGLQADAGWIRWEAGHAEAAGAAEGGEKYTSLQ